MAWWTQQPGYSYFRPRVPHIPGLQTLPPVVTKSVPFHPRFQGLKVAYMSKGFH